MRLALGASPGLVARQVLQDSLRNTVAGVSIGCILALVAGRFIRSLLVGVSASDPLTLLVVAVTLFTVATLAALGPARRAARIDPVDALRAE